MNIEIEMILLSTLGKLKNLTFFLIKHVFHYKLLKAFCFVRTNLF